MIGKPGLFRLHKWAGIVAAAFLFVQALTGLTLVFGAELSSLIDPAGMVSKPGSAEATPGRLIAAAEARYPGYRLSRLVYPATSDGTYFAHLANQHGALRYVSLDRHDASVLRSGTIWRFPVIAALNIHDRWLAGRAGMALVTAAGIALLVMAITGLAFWWPRRLVRKAISVRWDAKPRILLRQLHRTTGVLMFPFVLFMAVTGLTIVIPTVLEKPPQHWTTTASFARPAETALAIARQIYPDHAVRDIRIATPSRINVFFHAPERNSRAVHRIAVDPRTRRIEGILTAAQNRDLWIVTYPLHTGEFLGIAGRLIVFLTGLALAGLSAAGAVMWVQARQAKAQSAKSRIRKQSDAGTAPTA